MEFTAVGLGTWMMESDAKAAVAALRRGVDEGANHVDTAEMYGSGRVEEIVGEALRGLREKVFVVSKVLPEHAGYADTIAACERSLKRLRTDRLDVYLLHWRERRTPVEETFRAFATLKEQGKVRHWGVSNFSVKDMEEAVRLAGPGKIVCNQVLYHLKERAIEFDLVPWCKERGIAVVAYSPFGQGRLPDDPGLADVAAARGATPAQAALAFLTRDPGVIAIPKSSDAGRTAENVQAARLRLSEDEVRRIDRAFPARRRRFLPTI
jgi:diketogulonate reductase-like aldo/keto reductase